MKALTVAAAAALLLGEFGSATAVIFSDGATHTYLNSTIAARALASRAVSASSWTNRGCVADGASRLLSKLAYSGSLNTPDYCVNLCASQNFKYAGVQYGEQCWCGNSLDNGQGAKLDDSKCSQACSGASSQKCGGSYISNLYENPGSASSVSLGCFVDTPSRVLPNSANLNPVTRSSCIDACGKGNYKFAGVENGNECYCGDTQPTNKADGCNVKCTGSDDLCGAAWKIEVFGTGSGGGGSNSNSNNVTPPSDLNVLMPVQPLFPVALNAGAQAQRMVGSPPAASGVKLVWAHHMVGNTLSYKQDTWLNDINQAKAAGIDGFALNMGKDPWQPQSVAWAYAAAQQAGGFKLFFSFDMTSFGCANDGDGSTIASLISKYANHPAQAKYKNKVLVTTFAGENCNFGKGDTAAGWADVKAKSQVDYFFIPATFMTPANIQAASWFDGQMNWDAAWPNANVAPNIDRDTAWLSALGSKAYMASISPFFFTYYGANSWNKNWIYRSDDWLLATRFDQLIALRTHVDMIQLVSWNDYGESHYIGGIGADQPNSQGWTNNMPHTGLQSLVKYYATAFKTGAYPAAEDHIWLWTRPHPHGATASAPTNPRPNHWDWTYDNLYVVVTLSSAARVKIESGGNYAVWDLPSGLTKLALTSANGPVKVTATRGSAVIKSYDSSGKFAYSDTPKDYNFNYFVADA